MANLNEAFNTYKQPNTIPYDTYMDNLIKKIPNEESYDDIFLPNSLNQNFTNVNSAFDRVKVSNIKYDQIERTDKPLYGYKCKICNGSMGYHLSIQNANPHDFIRGNYVSLSPNEQGPYHNGMPF